MGEAESREGATSMGKFICGIAAQLHVSVLIFQVPVISKSFCHNVIDAVRYSRSLSLSLLRGPNISGNGSHTFLLAKFDRHNLRETL
jgi:hypothetical protein